MSDNDPYAPPTSGSDGAGQNNPYGQPQYGQAPSGQPPYGQQGPYGQPPYGQSPYGQPQYGQSAPTGPAYNPYPAGGPYYPGIVNRTNDKATWSLICGIASFFCFSILTGIPAIILGVLARAEIKRNGHQQQGDGMAIAGIVLGILSVVILIGVIIFGVIAVNHVDNYDPTGFSTTFDAT